MDVKVASEMEHLWSTPTMTKRHCCAVVAFTAALCPWPFAKPSVVAGQPVRQEDRIATREREVAGLRRELTELRKMTLNEGVMNKIRGNWKEVSHVWHGKPVVELDDVVWRLEPKRSTRCIHSPEPPVWNLGSMTLDATKDPVWVDFESKYWGEVGWDIRVKRGIMKIDGDRIYLALQDHAAHTPSEDANDNERPASFNSTEDNAVRVFVLERPVGKLLQVLRLNSSGRNN
jgi:hypothetical protein